MDTMIYKDLEWYIINETKKEKLLFLKDCFTKEMIIKFFDKYYVDQNFNIKFNFKYDKIWWDESYIRSILNGTFLSFLGKENLNIMKTTLKHFEAIKTIEDHVRLITKEEAQVLPFNIIKSSKQYWTMTPRELKHQSYVFVVNSNESCPSHIDWDFITNSNGIRPIISLKQNYDKPKIITSSLTPEQINRLKKLHNM